MVRNPQTKLFWVLKLWYYLIPTFTFAKFTALFAPQIVFASIQKKKKIMKMVGKCVCM
jgi:hypothetical protein